MSTQAATAAERYAFAFVDLLREGGKKVLDQGVKDIDTLAAVVESSEDFQRFLASPVISYDEARGFLLAFAKKAKLSVLTVNALQVLARNGRLADLPAFVAACQRHFSVMRGELVAEVATAHELTAAQSKELAAVLSAKTGKQVSLAVSVDPQLIGGLVVKIGSHMVDASLKTRLNTLKRALREVA